MQLLSPRFSEMSKPRSASIKSPCMMFSRKPHLKGISARPPQHFDTKIIVAVGLMPTKNLTVLWLLQFK